MTILVTGGTGSVGRHVVDALVADGRAVARVMTRRPREEPPPPGSEWAVGVLGAGRGLAEAVDGVDAIIHLASDYARPENDVVGTRELLDLARAGGVRHITYLSIVGIDRIPHPYYRRKIEVEEIVRSGPIPWCIVRSTQFHSFVDRYLRTLASLPIPGVLPADLRFQTIDEAEVGAQAARLALDGRDGYAPEVAGPEVLTLGKMAAAWFEARRSQPAVLPVPLPPSPGRIAGIEPEPWVSPTLDAYRRGENVPAGDHVRGTVTWTEYLRRDGAG